MFLYQQYFKEPDLVQSKLEINTISYYNTKVVYSAGRTRGVENKIYSPGITNSFISNLTPC